MNRILTITLSLMLCMVLALAAGCTQPATPPPVATPAPTTLETTATPAPTPIPTKISLTPGPTQTLPEVWSIEVQVGSNGEAIDPQIIITVRGGKGMNVIPEIDVRVTRSDGVVVEGKIPKPLSVGKSLSLAGTTKNNDRTEIWAISPQGERIKIYDAYVPFRSYN